jgi:hypothetical protein
VSLRGSRALGLKKVSIVLYRMDMTRAHTNVVKAVFPLPLGPNNKNVGCCAAAAAFL